jgi:hypothetical protein
MKIGMGVLAAKLAAKLAVVMTVAITLGLSPAAAQRAPRGTSASPAAGPGTTALSDGLKEFQKQLDGYLKLREELSRTLKPLSTAPGSAELTTRQQALAAAIVAARHGAKHGDVVNPEVAAHVTRIVTADFRRRNPAAENAALKEVPKTPRPVINKAYPADEALPTVPPLLLADLPRLPDNLQYRFFGRHVILLDADVQIIIDYVADALPPH